MSTGFHATLVGDGIENPANALTMAHAAEMFGVACRFRDTKGLAESSAKLGVPSGMFGPMTGADVRALHACIVAFDNLPGARELYGFPAKRDFAVLVGNERRGLSHELASVATDRVQLPMLSRRINCLNVAAASAVALYYLGNPPVGAMAVRRDPRSRRPELLLLGVGDHFELGSAIRSATGLGWNRAFVEDRDEVWFGVDRGRRAEGRAAARRGRNDILLVPCPAGAVFKYPRVTIITHRRVGVPLHRANLTGGSSQLVAIPDESRVESAAEDWTRCGTAVEFAHLQLPQTGFPYHYRLLATIAMAEIARQVGRRPDFRMPPGPKPPVYDHGLGVLAEAEGVVVPFRELLRY